MAEETQPLATKHEIQTANDLYMNLGLGLVVSHHDSGLTGVVDTIEASRVSKSWYPSIA